MGEKTNIQWSRSTWNPWIGCTKVSPGCDHCYASVSTPARALGVEWGLGQPRRLTSEANRLKPLRWNELARREQETGVSQTGDKWHTPGFWPVFCASLADVFDNEVDPEWRADLFRLIRATPNLTWLLLTKRIGNANSMIAAALSNEDIGHSVEFALWPWPNVWLGATIVDQAEADRDIPKLLAVPAEKRFLSIEPMLGPIEFSNVTRRADGVQQLGRRALDGIHWVICGGESDQPGMRARPFDLEWARSTVAQCKAACVPVFFKQTGDHVRAPRTDAIQLAMSGSWTADGPGAPYGIARPYARGGADPTEWPEDLRVREFPE